MNAHTRISLRPEDEPLIRAVDERLQAARAASLAVAEHRPVTSADATSEIRQALELFATPASVLEIRIPKAGRRGVVSGYFDDLDKAAAAIAREDARGEAPGIYVTAQPVAPALLARAENRLKDHAQDTTADHDVFRYRWLLFDFDAKRPAGISSTEAEHQAALGRAGEVRAYLASLGWPNPVEADSGNGAHLLYPVDLDATDRALVEGALKGLSARFSDDKVVVDTKVGNPARVWKVYGTLAR